MIKMKTRPRPIPLPTSFEPCLRKDGIDWRGYKVFTKDEVDRRFSFIPWSPHTRKVVRNLYNVPVNRDQPPRRQATSGSGDDKSFHSLSYINPGMEEREAEEERMSSTAATDFDSSCRGQGGIPSLQDWSPDESVRQHSPKSSEALTKSHHSVAFCEEIGRAHV